MALTLTTPSNAASAVGVPGGTGSRFVIKRIQFDDSYPSGGEPLTPGALGFKSIHVVLAHGEDSGYVPQYDYTNEKMAVYEAGADGAALDEVANTTDLSALYIRVVAYGI